MRSQTLRESLDFFCYLLDEEDREELTRIWLSKDFELSLPDFLKKYSKKRYVERREKRAVPQQTDDEALAKADAILNLFIGKEEELGGTV